MVGVLSGAGLFAMMNAEWGGRGLGGGRGCNGRGRLRLPRTLFRPGRCPAFKTLRGLRVFGVFRGWFHFAVFAFLCGLCVSLRPWRRESLGPSPPIDAFRDQIVATFCNFFRGGGVPFAPWRGAMGRSLPQFGVCNYWKCVGNAGGDKGGATVQDSTTGPGK